MNERMNIRRMQIPEKPELEWGSDPRRLITEEEWNAIAEDFRTRGSTSWGRVLTEAATMKLLDEKRMRKFSDSNWAAVEESLQSSRDNEGWFGFFRDLADINLIDEEFQTEAWIDNNWEHGLSQVGKYCKIQDWRTAALLAEALKILRPRERVVTAEQLTEIEEDFEDARAKKDWPRAALLAAAIKLVEPSRTPTFTDKEWQGLYASLEEGRKSRDWLQVANRVRDMYILAGGKVDITEKGIVVNPPEKKTFEGKTPPLPNSLEL